MSSFDGNDMLELMQKAVNKSDAEVHAHAEIFDGSTHPWVRCRCVAR